MSEMGTHTRPTDRRPLIAASAIALVALVAVASLWAAHDRQTARNDPRTGTTTETSQQNPGAGLTGPAAKQKAE